MSDVGNEELKTTGHNYFIGSGTHRDPIIPQDGPEYIDPILRKIFLPPVAERIISGMIVISECQALLQSTPHTIL
jgi:hypothetical protein